MNDVLKRSWVEINLSQIRKNYRIYKDNIPQEMDIMSVIKADAYGHGDVEIAKILSSEGVKNWAVSNVDEACRLRNAGCEGQILILGYTPMNQIYRVLSNNITQTLISEEYAKAVLSTGNRIKCQFAIDTGMNRIGLDADQVDECERIIRYYSDKLDVTGLFTHLCIADDYSEEAINFTKKQIEKFERVAKSVESLNLPHIHCMNSAGGLWHKSHCGNMVRLGIALYGLKPSYSNRLPEGIKPALVWKSVISMVKKVCPGESIGYGRSFIADRAMLVATIPTGYADGYNRQLSNRGHVLINDMKAPIIGRICMDQFMVDISELPELKMGDEVVLLDATYNADDMAETAGTIGYEIVCNISKRVNRIYISDD